MGNEKYISNTKNNSYVNNKLRAGKMASSTKRSNKKRTVKSKTKKNKKGSSIKITKNLSKAEMKKMLQFDIDNMTNLTLRHIEFISHLIRDQPDADKWLKKRVETITKNMEKIEKLYDKMMKELD